MLRVLIESPFAGETPGDTALNILYARLCVRDAIVNHHNAPFASHLLYPQPVILDDRVPEERALGINVGLRWGLQAQASVFYLDLGMSDGMRLGLEAAHKAERLVVHRLLHHDLWIKYIQAARSGNYGDGIDVWA